MGSTDLTHKLDDLDRDLEPMRARLTRLRDMMRSQDIPAAARAEAEELHDELAAFLDDVEARLRELAERRDTLQRHIDAN
jgi:chromosome condensin MukBEF ATPase and DNA-binding subunit MukB